MNCTRAVGSLTMARRSHVWLFEGAEGGKWVQDIAQQYEEHAESDDEESLGPRQNVKRARKE